MREKSFYLLSDSSKRTFWAAIKAIFANEKIQFLIFISDNLGQNIWNKRFFFLHVPIYFVQDCLREKFEMGNGHFLFNTSINSPNRIIMHTAHKYRQKTREKHQKGTS